MIQREDWRWHGMAGHFIGSANCCFHLVTDIGHVRVSTIGCYHEHDEPKTYETRHPIGAGEDSLYETMVFALRNGDIEDWAEFDGDRYATEEAAEEGHLQFCEKWATLDGDRRKVAA